MSGTRVGKPHEGLGAGRRGEWIYLEQVGRVAVEIAHAQLQVLANFVFDPAVPGDVSGRGAGSAWQNRRSERVNSADVGIRISDGWAERDARGAKLSDGARGIGRKIGGEK